MDYPCVVRPLDTRLIDTSSTITKMLVSIWYAVATNREVYTCDISGLTTQNKQYFSRVYGIEFGYNFIKVPNYNLDDIEKDILLKNVYIYEVKKEGKYSYVNISSWDNFVISLFEVVGYRREGNCLYV